jgi:hypothetical protein
MKWFRNLFKKKKKSYPQQDKFKLCIIVDNAEHLHETLGIIESRCEQLSKTVLNAYDKHNSLHESMDEILLECKHINEVVLALSVFYRYSELHRRKDTINKMLGL